MRMEWSQSLKSANSLALFVGIVAITTSDLLGQVAPPVPANPFRKAGAEPAVRRAQVRPQGAAAPNARASDWGEDEEEVERAAAGPIGAGVNIMQMPISVESSIFGVNDVGGNFRLKKVLRNKLDLIKREYPGLNDLEIDRLHIAGLGDIKRFQDQVAALNSKHQETLWTNDAGRQELFNEIPKMQHRIKGVHFFSNQSLLTKTLRVIVTKRQLTPQEIPGEGHALNLPEGPPVPNGGFAIRQVTLADGKMAIMLEHMDIQRPVPVARRPLLPVPKQQNPVPRLDDKYILKLSQLISNSLAPETPIRDEQREPLLVMLRRASKQVPQIPLIDPDVALSRLSQLPEKEYLTVLDAKQWKMLQRRFEAAEVRMEKLNQKPMPSMPDAAAGRAT
jgi:hypothetical protein